MKHDKLANDELLEVIEKAKVFLEKKKRRGQERIKMSGETLASLDAATAKPRVTDGGKDRIALLEEVSEVVAGCTKCHLAETRTNVVFGDGNPHAKLMFIGEAPGADEDAQGLPFVGRAGQLLTKIIEAIDLKRSDVYICNILKCRPPGNRAPTSLETECCIPYLMRQIELIQPKIICALGNSSAQTLLQSKAPMNRMRGRFHKFQNAILMPTYHPAALLRNPAYKRSVWEDVQMIQREYENL